MKFSPDKLVTLRKLNGLTQAKLAELVGSNQSRIGKYEAGLSNPRTNMLIRLAEALKCNTSDLMDEIKPAKDYSNMFGEILEELQDLNKNDPEGFEKLYKYAKASQEVAPTETMKKHWELLEKIALLSESELKARKDSND